MLRLMKDKANEEQQQLHRNAHHTTPQKKFSLQSAPSQSQHPISAMAPKIVSHVPISVGTRTSSSEQSASDSTISSTSNSAGTDIHRTNITTTPSPLHASTPASATSTASTTTFTTATTATKVSRSKFSGDSFVESSLTPPRTSLDHGVESQKIISNSKSNSNSPSSVAATGNKRKAHRVSIDEQQQQQPNAETIATVATPVPPSPPLQAFAQPINKRLKRSIHLPTSHHTINVIAATTNGSLQQLHQQQRHASPTAAPITLLRQPEDDHYLNDLHIFVRRNIEVFAATTAELSQPAPGRKHPIRMHQVGLRCIHCRDLPHKNRVKRAVCYPTSVSRVYHSVSDMKFDHFMHCPKLPHDLRQRFQDLKNDRRRCNRRTKAAASSSGNATASTAQYYYDSAIRMGMVNGRHGIFFDNATKTNNSSSSNKNSKPASAPLAQTQNTQATPPTSQPHQVSPYHSKAASLLTSLSVLQCHPSMAPMMPATSVGSTTALTTATSAATAIAAAPSPPSSIMYSLLAHGASTPPLPGVSAPCTKAPTQSIKTGIPLASSDDPAALNPLHCFVRRNIEVFEANAEHIAAPAPGRKAKVTLGQVGIRCTHCAQLQPRQRVKRAVCYPPSVAGIYHSVSNMKFDHFANCKGLPAKERDEFLQLKKSCSRHRSTSRLPTSTTAQYYQESAMRMGLVDTSEGIRYVSKVQTQQSTEIAALLPPLRARTQISSGISALMMAAAQTIV